MSGKASGPRASTIHERLIAILGELPALGKDSKNEQQRFMFRSFDAIQNALNPKLAEHGVFVVPRVLERISEERKTKSGSTMFAVHLLVEFRFYGAGGDYVTATTCGEGTDLGDKATSKAHTMALKTALNEVFAISSEEFADPDGQTPEESAPKPARPKPSTERTSDGTAPSTNGTRKPTQKEMARFFAIAKEHGIKSSDELHEFVKKHAAKDSFKELLKADLEVLVPELQKRPKASEAPSA